MHIKRLKAQLNGLIGEELPAGFLFHLYFDGSRMEQMDFIFDERKLQRRTRHVVGCMDLELTALTPDIQEPTLTSSG